MKCLTDYGELNMAVYTVSSGASLSNNYYISSTDVVNVYGTANSFLILNGAQIAIQSGGKTSNTLVGQDSSEVVAGGGSALNTIVNSGGNLIVSSGGTLNYATINSGGNIILSSGATLNYQVSVTDGASATIYAGASVSYNYNQYGINFVGNTNNELTIDGLVDGGSIGVPIYGFRGANAGDTTVIKLTGIKEENIKNTAYVDSTGQANGDYITFTLMDGNTITLNIVGVENAGYSLDTAADGSLLFKRIPALIISAGDIETGSSYTDPQNFITVSGTASNFSIANNAIINVISGGVLSNTQVNTLGSAAIYDGGFATSTVINSGGYQSVTSGGIADNTIVQSGGTLSVLSSGITSNTHIHSGGLEVIGSGGSAVNASVYAGGTQSISYAGSAIGTIISGAGAIQKISPDGVAISTVINSGGLLDNQAGGVTSGIIVNSGGVLVTYGRDSPVGPWESLSYDTIINAGGIEYVGSNPFNGWGEYSESYNARIYGSQVVTDRANASNAIIYSGGVQRVSKEGAAVYTTVNDGGILIADSGRGFVANVTVNSGGSLIVSQGGVLIGGGDTIYSYPGSAVISSGGNLVISSGATLRGELLINNGASATINADINLNDSAYPVGSITFVGDENNGLTIAGLANGGNVNVTIRGTGGIDGSTNIKLVGISQDDVTDIEYVDYNGVANENYVTFLLKNGEKITLNIVGVESENYSLRTSSDGDLTFGNSSYEVCFLTGSMIKTLAGEIAIEKIHIGDQVITFDYKNNQEIVHSVRWVGNKKTKVRFGFPDDMAGYPVRIVKNAIADNVPYKDLLITSEHCLFFNGQFIPVRMLVNGSTIFYDHSITEYTYYHIELEQHSVIIANGVLTESYLDTGNRSNFKQSDKIVLLDKLFVAKSWGKDTCYPLITEREIVEPLYHQIHQRSAYTTIDHEKIIHQKQLTNDPNIRLITPNGKEIYPVSYTKERYLFNIPQNIETAYIASEVSRPCDVIGSFVDDRRYLGVLINDITLITQDKIYKMTDYLSQLDLEGWDVIENSSCRWTNGNAFISLNYNTSLSRVLIINIIPVHSYLLDDNTVSDINYKKMA